ncbi:MAG TPA: hypothetical protein VLB74_10375 [Flavobacterium sp.]|uniref:hypothetical protein n=1 Tax=Flavobacterium sp. TaxID=239 RepID=UPI002BCDE407|nr:hypothetical protein [Flavobacterium sp.]HSD15042.1 hypothetical protein [Flavobacterium sp.]
MKKLFKFSVAILLLSSIIFTSKFIISCSKEQNEDTSQLKNEVSNFSKISDSMVVGEIINGQYVITADKTELLLYFSKLADDQGLGEVVFENISILKKELIDNGNTEYYYGLYASDKDFKYNSAISLTLDGNYFKMDALGGGGTITCSSVDCGTGCTPYQKAVSGGKVWTCSSCSKPCTKTMSVTIP